MALRVPGKERGGGQGGRPQKGGYADGDVVYAAMRTHAGHCIDWVSIGERARERKQKDREIGLFVATCALN